MTAAVSTIGAVYRVPFVWSMQLNWNGCGAGAAAVPSSSFSKKVPLMLGIWGGKGQGKSVRCALVFAKADAKYGSDAPSPYNLSSAAQCSISRRALIFGIGAIIVNSFPMSSLLAQGTPKNYEIFVDKIDGYSYYYPSDWRDFDFRGHDSAFKDRTLQLQNVRLSFIPTDKTDIHDLGQMEEVVANLVTNVYSAPNQVGTILDMQERNIEGRNYWTFEYILTSPNFARAAFATIAIGNGRYYTLIVGANERRWKKFRNQLKVVADSFKVLDI